MRHFFAFLVASALVFPALAKKPPKIVDQVRKGYNSVRVLTTPQKIFDAVAPNIKTKEGVKYLEQFAKQLKNKKFKNQKIQYSLNRRNVDILFDKTKYTIQVINPYTGKLKINGVPVTLDKNQPPVENIKKISKAIEQSRKKNQNAFMYFFTPQADAWMGWLLGLGAIASLAWWFWDDINDLWEDDDEDQQEYAAAANQAGFTFKAGEGASCLTNGAVLRGRQDGRDVTYTVTTPIDSPGNPKGYSYVTRFEGHQDLGKMGTFGISRLEDRPGVVTAFYSGGGGGPTPTESYQVVHNGLRQRTFRLVGEQDPIRSVSIQGTFSANEVSLPDGDSREGFLQELTAMGECCTKGQGTCEDDDIARNMSVYSDGNGATVIRVRQDQ